MRKTFCYRRFSTRWWGLPLLLPLILMPVSGHFSARLQLAEGYVYLIYLPLAMMVAMLMVFDWAALPGICVALLFRYFPLISPPQALTLSVLFLIAICISWAGYRLHARNRWGVGFGELSMAPIRLFWLAFFLPTLMLILLQMVVTLGVLPEASTLFSRDPFTIRTLINFQALLLSCVSLLQVYYWLIRIVKNPRFAAILWQRLQRQMAEDVTFRELFCWGVLMTVMLGILTHFRLDRENLLTSDYTLTLLLPLMLWAAMRFGHLLTSLSWSLILIALYQFREQFIDLQTQLQHLAIISSNLLVFTVTIFLMAAIGTHQRRVIIKAKRAALTDPVIGLPNLRALSADLAARAHSTICFLRIPELDLLSRTYGLQLRIQYKRCLAGHLRPFMQPGEEVYQLPGFDLALRLDSAAPLVRVEEISARLKNYRLTWDGLPLQPSVGLSFCSVRPPISHLHELLGELSAMAEVSLNSGLPENLQQGGIPVQRKVKDKLAMLHEVQFALDNDKFVLLAQRIQGLRGDDYHEILLRMVDTHGEQLKPQVFLPVVHEFGMSWEIDRWVLEQTLSFMDQQRAALPAARFAVNLFASTICRPHLAKEIGAMLQRCNIEPWQLIIEVEESHMLSDLTWGNRSINQLRELGCPVAIDDFGTGYASYTRLREIQADILKIDGSFVRNILSSSLDYHIIESICCVARLRRMKVVAEFVESEDIAAALRKMGVDYLQGYAVSLPQLLVSLAPAAGEKINP
ncbi:EAL domain-containing protein [Pantoea sp. B65]|uniref:EAL domain-containing protein n=1 Tax=Pantoea sp. B65 TaxID=2813359 RepID=UPI0039B5B9AA